MIQSYMGKRSNLATRGIFDKVFSWKCESSCSASLIYFLETGIHYCSENVMFANKFSQDIHSPCVIYAVEVCLERKLWKYGLFRLEKSEHNGKCVGFLTVKKHRIIRTSINSKVEFIIFELDSEEGTVSNFFNLKRETNWRESNSTSKIKSLKFSH